MFGKPYYNKHRLLSKIPYKIVEKIALSKNENIWKVLNYSDYDCLSKPDLKFSQKMNLIWKNENDELSYRIFFKPLVSSEITNSITQLRINKIKMSPNDKYTTTILYQFMIITGEKIAIMKDEDGTPVSRVDYLEEELLKVLNGADIGIGSSRLEFNKELSRDINETLSINNGKTAFGTSLIMGLNLTDLEDSNCGG